MRLRSIVKFSFSDSIEVEEFEDGEFEVEGHISTSISVSYGKEVTLRLSERDV
jgi:hypothetical protein